eukprot:CAMPEP_0205882972 /NCGR_PEP_ID=MMETSP1083-20121108/17289_1 /ASSEMBLY_ACC=CAM_ASM_000430 /TAXON_ID=97485 /ORGANISM="Prymnesium parvum, Strain Texoma1" /LENGTH=89 /DNA_ID=CAMNT_0053246181 /DNA_START=77 /DNA_END=344 /DNA_ORIENTATION=+
MSAAVAPIQMDGGHKPAANRGRRLREYARQRAPRAPLVDFLPVDLRRPEVRRRGGVQRVDVARLVPAALAPLRRPRDVPAARALEALAD